MRLIVLASALLLSFGCSPAADEPEQTAPHPTPAQMPAEMLSDLQKRALGGDIEASETLLEYVSHRPDLFSKDDNVRWAAVAHRNGSNDGSKAFIFLLIASESCDRATEAYREYAARPGADASNTAEMIRSVCGSNSVPA